jgi:hypothetical protein
MANDAERVDVSGKQDALPDELSGFDSLVLTDTKRLYGEHEGQRTPIQDLGHVVISFAAQAAETEVEQLSPPAQSGRRTERTQRNGDIEARVQRLVDERINALTQQHEQQRQEMQSEIERLRAEIERLQKPLHERLNEAFGDNWVPRHQGISVDKRGGDGFMESGWTTTGDPFERDGEWYIRVEKDGGEEEVKLANLARTSEATPPGAQAREFQQGDLVQVRNEAGAVEPDWVVVSGAWPRREGDQDVLYVTVLKEGQPRIVKLDDLREWNPETAPPPAAQENGLPDGSRPVYRRRGRFGQMWDRIRGRQTGEYVATGAYATPDGGYVRVVDEEIVEVPPSEFEARDGTARVMGGLALVGVGILALHELLEHKYLGHSPTREMRHNGIYPWGWWPKGAHELHHHAAHLKDSANQALNHGNGAHTDWYNPSEGHRRTGVELSRAIHLTGQPGNEHLVDGNTTLLGGKKVNWDSQGKLSRWDMSWLRKHNYHVGWARIQDTVRGIYRYKTTVAK